MVLASPATLYALLSVMRRGVDSFRLASAAREVVELLSGFRDAWRAYQGESERLGKALAEAQDAFDRLKGARARQLERRLDRLDRLVDDSTVATEGKG